jgi:SAM-dependent methyltransferase
VTVTSWLLQRSLVYRAWQRPFAERKLAPMLKRGDIARARRVLDVGCGPGTNVPHFIHADYVGIDVNPQYIASASRRFAGRFIVADVRDYSTANEGLFDFVFVNSLLHHLDTAAVRQLLLHLSTLLTADGHVHILDLVLPPQRWSIAGVLARADRGDFPRPLVEWWELFAEAFNIVEFEPYSLGAGQLTMWNMVYCKARSRL